MSKLSKSAYFGLYLIVIFLISYKLAEIRSYGVFALAPLITCSALGGLAITVKMALLPPHRQKLIRHLRLIAIAGLVATVIIGCIALFVSRFLAT